MKKKNHLVIFGGHGRSLNPLAPKRAARPHHRADICIIMNKINHQFFIYGPQCETKMHFWLFGLVGLLEFNVSLSQ